MSTFLSKPTLAIVVTMGVIFGSTWASAGNLPTWGGQTTTTQPQPIQQPRQPIVSQPSANIAPSVQTPQPGTWTAPGTTSGTGSGTTVITPTQQPSYRTQPSQPATTPRTGPAIRMRNLQPKAVSRHLRQRESGFGPQLPVIAPVTNCSRYRQTPDVDRLSVPPTSPTYPPRAAPGADLHCTDLTAAHLMGADLSGANLRGANLAGADLSGADLSGALLEDADLTGANLRSARFNNAKLNRARLVDTVLATADGADFRGAVIDNMEIVPGGTFKNAHFDGLDFAKLNVWVYKSLNADFSGATFENSKLSRINLGTDHERQSALANFSNAYLVRAQFIGTSISDVIFIGANLSQADFSGAVMKQVDFSGATITGAKFTRISPGGSWDPVGGNLRDYRGPEEDRTPILSSLNFTGTIAMEADFSQADLREQAFSGTDLSRAIFDKAFLSRSRFTKTNLTGASFVESNLGGSYFDGVNAEKAKLGAHDPTRLYSTDMRWITIKGSNFKLAGMSYVDMSHSLIQDSSFYQTSLDQGKFEGVMFASPDLRMANFQASDLSGSLFTPATQFYGANFTGAKMIRIGECYDNVYNYNNPPSLVCPQGQISPLDLRSVDFRGADLTDVYIPGSDLRNSNLAGSNLNVKTAFGYKLSGAIMPDGTVHP